MASLYNYGKVVGWLQCCLYDGNTWQISTYPDRCILCSYLGTPKGGCRYRREMPGYHYLIPGTALFPPDNLALKPPTLSEVYQG